MWRNTCIGLLSLTIVASALAQDNPALFGTSDHYERGPFEVMWDPALPLPDKNAVARSLMEGVEAKAGLDSAFPKEAVKRVKVSVSGNPMQIVVSADTKPGAVEAQTIRGVADAVAGSIAEVLARHAAEASEMKAHQLNQELAERRAQLREFDHMIGRLREELRQRSGFADVTPEGIQKTLSGIDQELRKLQLDMVGQTARQKALERAVADVAKQAEQRVKADPIAAELEKIVAMKREAAERVRKLMETGQVTGAELAASEAAVAEARAQLLQRNEQSSRGAGMDLLSELNRELLMLSITAAETAARLDFAKDSVQKAQPALEMLNEIERRRLEASRLEATMSDTEKALAELRRQVTSRPSNVVVRERRAGGGR